MKDRPKIRRVARRSVPTRREMGVETEEERRQRIFEERSRIKAKWRPKIPEVRKVNFEHFKNHYGGDNPEYAVEALVGPLNIGDQIRSERSLRGREELGRLRRAIVATAQAHAAKPQWKSSEKTARSEKQSVQGSESSYIHRVRIQSQPVLAHLTQLLGESDRRSWSRTFFRPFKPLVYFQPQMRKALEGLIEKYGHLENGDIGQSSPEEASQGLAGIFGEIGEEEDGGDSDSEGRDDAVSNASLETEASDDGALDLVMDSLEALRDMRCYVDFVDREILPLYQKFENLETRKVAFDDLWSLFRLGELVYVPAAHDSAQRYQELWRVYRIEVPEPDLTYPPADFGWFQDEVMQTGGGDFNISCYYIDHDGSAYGAVRNVFSILPFPGERDIDSLEIYPARFLSSDDNTLERLKKQGSDFQKYLRERHQAYNFWTLTTNPSGESSESADGLLLDVDGKAMRHPQFIESDVIIDVAEAIQSNPDWKPEFHRPSASKSDGCGSKEDVFRIQHWADSSRTTLLYTSPDLIQTEDGIDMRQRNDNIKSDQFLSQRTKGVRVYGVGQQALSLRNDDLVLLPKRMFAYALRERKFALVDIRYLKPIIREHGVFENLKILRNYKDIIRGLVNTHFQKKELERRLVSMSTEGISQDLIQAKGRGLVILLHGVPGVGKTATAEAVAVENNKPLFVITCGDLGLTPKEVESSLTNVFRLAHMWDCVLLLDEADVFLSQRTRLDMTRNALVSVFLRVLEYYNGLLFLTTNRVGTMDEAFKSRIHVSLYYPRLDKIQTREIFRLNINKLRLIEQQRHELTKQPLLDIKEEEILKYAEDHFDRNFASGSSWNGRQIRNAFQIASSLAYHNYATETEAASTSSRTPAPAPILDPALFRKVEHATLSFDQYMREAKGWSDADLAHLAGERADHLKNSRTANHVAHPAPQPSFGPSVSAASFSTQQSGLGGAGYGPDPYSGGDFRYGAEPSTPRYNQGTSPSLSPYTRHGMPQQPDRFGFSNASPQAPGNVYGPSTANDGRYMPSYTAETNTMQGVRYS